MDATPGLQGLQALTLALTLYEKGAKIVRGWAGKLSDTQEKQDATKDLEKAEEAMELAKAQMAESLGYHLCRRHFPPGIMLKVREGVFSCKTCGDTIGNTSSHQTQADTYF